MRQWARTFVVGRRTVAQSGALFQGFISVRIGCLRIPHHSVIRQHQRLELHAQGQARGRTARCFS